MENPIICHGTLTLYGTLNNAAEATFNRAADMLAHIGNPKALRAGVKVAALARKIEALAAEADRLSL